MQQKCGVAPSIALQLPTSWCATGRGGVTQIAAREKRETKQVSLTDDAPLVAGESSLSSSR